MTLLHDFDFYELSLRGFGPCSRDDSLNFWDFFLYPRQCLIASGYQRKLVILYPAIKCQQMKHKINKLHEKSHVISYHCDKVQEVYRETMFAIIRDNMKLK